MNDSLDIENTLDKAKNQAPSLYKLWTEQGNEGHISTSIKGVKSMVTASIIINRRN